MNCRWCGKDQDFVDLDECENMLKQIEGIENFHGKNTNITMTTAEAKAFVNTALQWCNYECS